MFKLYGNKSTSVTAAVETTDAVESDDGAVGQTLDPLSRQVLCACDGGEPLPLRAADVHPVAVSEEAGTVETLPREPVVDAYQESPSGSTPTPLPWRQHGGQFQFDLADGSVWVIDINFSLVKVFDLHRRGDDGAPDIAVEGTLRYVPRCLVPARPVEVK